MAAEGPCLCPKCGIELQAQPGSRCPLCGTPLQSKAELAAAKKAEPAPKLDPAFAPTNPRLATVADDADAAKTLPGIPSPADDAKTNPAARVPGDQEAQPTAPGGWETGAAPDASSVSAPSAPFRTMPSLVPSTTMLPPPPFVGTVPKPAPPAPNPILFRGGAPAPPPPPGSDVTTVTPDPSPSGNGRDDDDAVPASSLEVVEQTPAPIPASALEARLSPASAPVAPRWPSQPPAPSPLAASPPPPPPAPRAPSPSLPPAPAPRLSTPPQPSPVAAKPELRPPSGPAVASSRKPEPLFEDERSRTERSPSGSVLGSVFLTLLVLAAIAGAFYAGRVTANVNGVPVFRIP